jgi:hypothetical protein
MVTMNAVHVLLNVDLRFIYSVRIFVREVE